MQVQGTSVHVYEAPSKSGRHRRYWGQLALLLVAASVIAVIAYIWIAAMVQ